MKNKVKMYEIRQHELKSIQGGGLWSISGVDISGMPSREVMCGTLWRSLQKIVFPTFPK